MKRLLITGSRDWHDELVIHKELRAAYDELSEGGKHPVMLVSGACPTGADRMCERWWHRQGWPVERHPAKWARYGKQAGFRRNAFMVHKGADLCIAFIRLDSAGATHTANLAEKNNIPTRRIRDDKPYTPPAPKQYKGL